jgi:hypothetical protein
VEEESPSEKENGEEVLVLVQVLVYEPELGALQRASPLGDWTLKTTKRGPEKTAFSVNAPDEPTSPAETLGCWNGDHPTKVPTAAAVVVAAGHGSLHVHPRLI